MKKIFDKFIDVSDRFFSWLSGNKCMLSLGYIGWMIAPVCKSKKLTFILASVYAYYLGAVGHRIDDIHDYVQYLYRKHL